LRNAAAKAGIIGCVFQALGHIVRDPIEIRSDADVVDARNVCDMIDVGNNVVDSRGGGMRGRGVLPPILLGCVVAQLAIENSLHRNPNY